jgi:hypothetical protein
MNERDRRPENYDEGRYQTQPESERGNYEQRREQQRARHWQNRPDYRAVQQRDWNTEGRDDQHDRSFSSESRRYGNRGEYGGYPEERDYNTRNAGYSAQRFPATFGSPDDHRYSREAQRQRLYESERDHGSYGQGDRDRDGWWRADRERNQNDRYGVRGDYNPSEHAYNEQAYGGTWRWRAGTPERYDPQRWADRGTGYFESGDSRGRDHESFGQQMRDMGHDFAQKVKRAFRGPKGYKRTDDRIREDVNDRLAEQSRFDPSDMEVQVANGEVTLTGSVRFRFEKFLAEEIADDVSGVNEVHNQLRVRREQGLQNVGTGTESTGLGTQNANETGYSGTQNSTDATRNRNARA